MKNKKQNQSAVTTPGESSAPVRVNFDGEVHRKGTFDFIHGKCRTSDGQIILSARATSPDFRSLRLCVDLGPVDARAVTRRLRDATAVRRRMCGGYFDLIQPPAEIRLARYTFDAEFVTLFLPRVATRISFANEHILLELHGGNAQVRLFLSAVDADALVFDLERAIEALEVFK